MGCFAQASKSRPLIIKPATLTLPPFVRGIRNMGEKGSSLSFGQGDLIMGMIMLAFSVVFYYFSYHFGGYEIEKIPHDVGPAFLPRLLLGALAIESVVLIFSGVLKNADVRSMKPIFQSRPIVMLAAFLVYIFLCTFFGYIIATLAFMVLAFFLLGVRGVWTLILLPPIITFATWFLFGIILGIYLPTGSLF